jgi:glycosyltransferase involved in cell wall biosynthesis
MHMSSTYELAARRRLMGGPVTLFWSHGYNMDRGLGSLRQSLIQWPRSMLAALADGHICYSEEGRDYLSSYMSNERLFVARNTIDVASVQTMARHSVATKAPGRPHILTIGRLTLDKDFPRLIRVFHQLREDFPNAGLTIIGDGVDFERTRAAAGSSLDDSIIMTGAIYEEEELAPYLLSADAVVFTGAVGLSVNHALAYGVPVIAFDRTPTGPHHHPEIAYVVDGVTGNRVPQNTDEALATTLRDFFTRHADPKAAFRDSIEDYVARNLTIDTYVEDFGEANNFIQNLMRK